MIPLQYQNGWGFCRETWLRNLVFVVALLSVSVLPRISDQVFPPISYDVQTLGPA